MYFCYNTSYFFVAPNNKNYILYCMKQCNQAYSVERCATPAYPGPTPWPTPAYPGLPRPTPWNDATPAYPVERCYPGLPRERCFTPAYPMERCYPGLPRVTMLFSAFQLSFRTLI